MVYSDIILKHYLAEGVVNRHSLFIASQDVNTTEFVSIRRIYQVFCIVETQL